MRIRLACHLHVRGEPRRAPSLGRCDPLPAVAPAWPRGPAPPPRETHQLSYTARVPFPPKRASGPSPRIAEGRTTSKGIRGGGTLTVFRFKTPHVRLPPLSWGKGLWETEGEVRRGPVTSRCLNLGTR